MIPVAATLTSITLLGLLFWGADTLVYLSPYRDRILAAHWRFVLLYVVLLAVNLFAGYLWLARVLGLRRAGRRLRHLQDEGALGDDLTSRVED